MDLWELKLGVRVRLESGSVGEILAPTEDGDWIRIRYVQAPDEPHLVGTEDLCSSEEILGLADLKSRGKQPDA